MELGAGGEGREGGVPVELQLLSNLPRWKALRRQRKTPHLLFPGGRLPSRAQRRPQRQLRRGDLGGGDDLPVAVR